MLLNARLGAGGGRGERREGRGVEGCQRRNSLLPKGGRKQWLDRRFSANT